jgi:integrase
MTLDQAFGAYFADHASRLASAKTIEYQLDRILAELGKATDLDQLNDRMISEMVQRRRGQVCDSSVNRELTLLRAVLNRARDAWGADVARINWKRHRLLEPEHRTRYLQPAEADRLLRVAPRHLAPIIRCALWTGLRLGNLLALDWSQIDLQQGAITVHVKSRKPGGKVLTVPIGDPLRVMFEAMGAYTSGRVFRYMGRPIAKLRRSFATALRRAKIQNFRFHDLRHTAASWMIQGGTPLEVVRQVLGHEDIHTTLRYAHHSQDAQRKAIDAIAKLWAGAVTKTAQRSG